METKKDEQTHAFDLYPFFDALYFMGLVFDCMLYRECSGFCAFVDYTDRVLVADSGVGKEVGHSCHAHEGHICTA